MSHNVRRVFHLTLSGPNSRATTHPMITDDAKIAASIAASIIRHRAERLGVSPLAIDWRVSRAA